MVVVGGIYSLQPPPSCWLTLLSTGTPDSPVVHRTWHYSLSGACHVSCPLGFGAVGRWSPLSSCCTKQFGVFWLRCSDFWLAHCSLFIWHCSRPLGAVDRCFIGSPNMSGAHRTVQWIIEERLWKNPRAASSWVPWPGHRTVSSAPLAAPMLVFAPNFVEFPNLFSLLVYVELYAPEINDN
jgi:hypothetical protein